MRKDEIFFIIKKINEELALSSSPKQIQESALDILLRVMKIDACWVYLLDNENREPVLVASRGLPGKVQKELQEPELKLGLNRRILTAEKVIIPDLSRDTNLGSSSLSRAGFISLIAVPLRTYHVQGVLGVMSRMPRRFDKDYASLLMVIGNLLCAALDKAKLHHIPGRPFEPGAESKYDIKEFENLVALAERYRDATQMAIRGAMLKMKGAGDKPPETGEPPAELSAGAAPEAETRENIDSSKAETVKAEADAKYGERAGHETMVPDEKPAAEKVKGVGQVGPSRFQLHKKQMERFIKNHSVAKA